MSVYRPVGTRWLTAGSESRVANRRCSIHREECTCRTRCRRADDSPAVREGCATTRGKTGKTAETSATTDTLMVAVQAQSKAPAMSPSAST